MTHALTFREHCIEGARYFVQTAVVIDNEANLGRVPSSEPRRASRASSSLLDRAEDAKTVGQAKIEAVGPESPPVMPIATVSPNPVSVEQNRDVPGFPSGLSPAAVPEDSQSHALDAKSLMDAFLEETIICGLYKPEPTEQIVELSVKAAQHADIVILDWYLLDSNSQTAKEIVKRILKSDVDENGRLRLIAIYTAVPDLSTLANELLGFINEDAILKEKFKLASSGDALSSPDTRISFVNKPKATEGIDIEGVLEKNLPDRLLKEFAYITEGVLATFAVNSIAAVRRAAHHIIAMFKKELDGTYVSHRCSIPHPEDAKEFATEMVSSEIRNVITMEEVAERAMAAEVLDLWVDHIASNGRVFADFEDAEVPMDVVKRLLRRGKQYVSESQGEQVLRGNKKPIRAYNLARLFYDSPDQAKKRNLEFARQASFKREAFGKTQFPKSWRPTLTLGSVLKFQRPKLEEQKTSYADISTDYLICVQPRCDSVRLARPTAFPFQTANPDPQRFNIVVKDESTEGVELLVGYKPRDAVMIRFEPDDGSKTVRASVDEQNRFVFIDSQKRTFLWLGDLKDLKAQDCASELASRVHSVGHDEFEWLRLSGQLKGKSEP